ncbi:MAG: FAD-dependent oxidoreductase [Myxococcota bacterium]
MSESRVAIIGAGICGLSCAQWLQRRGVSVRLFDKARKAGGRMSTRRGPEVTFDHGAQYFTVRSDALGEVVQTWADAGVAKPWTGRIAVARHGSVTAKGDGVTRWVGTPTMSAIPRHLAAGLDVAAQTRVGAVERDHDGWRLIDTDGVTLGTASTVLLTTPAGQAVDLLAAAPQLAERVAAVEMEPCWAVMVSLERPWEIPADGVFVDDSPVAWAARDGSKPGRGARETWVLHATPAWTRAHWDDDAATVVQTLTAALAEASGVERPSLAHADTQRWRYARADAPLPERALWDPELRIGVAGDWCGGPRVEGAWLGGRALAERVLADAPNT